MTIRPESAFYAKLRFGLAEHNVHFYRVENKLDLSLPDAFFTCNEGSGWAEFKIAKQDSRGWHIDWSGRKKQLMTIREFSTRGVPIIVLARCGEDVALLSGSPPRDGELWGAKYERMTSFASIARHIETEVKRS